MSAKRKVAVGDKERTCTKCHETKPLVDFGATSNPYSLTSSDCLACRAAYARKRYQHSTGPRAGIGGQPRKHATP